MAEHPTSIFDASKRARIAVSIGVTSFSLFAMSLLLNPAQQYKLSVYNVVPLPVWSLLVIGVGTSVFLTVFGQTKKVRLSGSILAWSGAVLITAIPFFRSYVFFGRFDTLNHLGIIRDFLAGVSANTVIYPALHLLSSTTVLVTGLAPEKVLIGILPVFVLLYALGMYCIADRWEKNRWALAVGSLVPLSVPFVIVVRLPKLLPIPTVTAILLFPFLLYLFFAGLSFNRRFLIVLLIAATAHVLYHPQHALLFAVGAIIGSVVVRILYRREPVLRIGFMLPTYVAVFLTFWISSKPGFAGALTGVYEGLQSDTGVVEGATPSGTSLAAVGGSLIEVGIKVFVSRTILILCGCVIALYLYARYRHRLKPSHKQSYVLGFSAGALLFIPIFATSVARSQMFRYVGLLMLFLLISVIIYLSDDKLADLSGTDRSVLNYVIAIAVFLSFVTALPTTYKSPYVYQPSEQVTEATFEGYEYTFEQHFTRPVLTIENSPDRYRNALYGKYLSSQQLRGPPKYPSTGTVGPRMNNRTFHNVTGTLIVPAYARIQNRDMYKGVDYSRADFQYLEMSAGISKVYSNGGTTVYQGWNNTV